MTGSHEIDDFDHWRHRTLATVGWIVLATFPLWAGISIYGWSKIGKDGLDASTRGLFAGTLLASQAALTSATVGGIFLGISYRHPDGSPLAHDLNEDDAHELTERYNRALLHRLTGVTWSTPF